MKNKTLIILSVLCVSVAILFNLNCNNENWVLFRASQDYFPLANGNTWHYQTDNTATVIEVNNDTIINNIKATIVTRNFENQYWLKNQGEVKKLTLRTVNYGGNDYTIQASWLLQYRLPFIIGSTWSDVFTDTADVLGDIYYIKETIARQITAIEHITVPAGSFFETYRIDFVETCQINDSLESYTGSEWFAPGVGLVKRIANNIEQVLTDYLIE
jgi:hypothetical protein